MIFFSADAHFGHENIIKYCNRPFDSVEKMNDVIKNKWNSRVKPNDIVYHIGDFCFTNTSDRGEGRREKWLYYYNQLNGQKLIMEGNHDRRNGIRSHITSMTVRLRKLDLFLTHRPSDVMFGYDLYLVGHVHEKWKHKVLNDGSRNHILINVGVDVWNFMPITIEEILGYVNRTI